jgi:hypothetical protein
MTTEKQIEANRLNALLGGVKTEEGKADIRHNAVSHGFFSKEILIEGENRAEMETVRESFFAEFKPEGELETVLVELIISSSWRLKRVLRSERTHPRNIPDYRNTSYQNVMRYVTTLERQIYRALHELERLQKARLDSQPEATPPVEK